MRVENIVPNMVIYNVTPEEGEDPREWMSVRYTFDCNDSKLYITGSYGDYSCNMGIPNNPGFMYLMKEISYENLLDNIFYRSVYNLSKSKELTIENIKKDGLELYSIEDEEELEAMIDSIEKISPYSSEDSYIKAVCDIVPGIHYSAIELVKEYPMPAKKVAEIFIKYIQPQIKKDFKY